jgi:hypothetical protein
MPDASHAPSPRVWSIDGISRCDASHTRENIFNCAVVLDETRNTSLNPAVAGFLLDVLDPDAAARPEGSFTLFNAAPESAGHNRNSPC